MVEYDVVLNSGNHVINELTIDTLINKAKINFCGTLYTNKVNLLYALRYKDTNLCVSLSRLTFDTVKDHTNLDKRFNIMSLEDFLVKYSKRAKPNYVEVQLNSKYCAIVKKDTIEVGCQTFPVSKLRELVEAVEQIKE